ALHGVVLGSESGAAWPARISSDGLVDQPGGEEPRQGIGNAAREHRRSLRDLVIEVVTSGHRLMAEVTSQIFTVVSQLPDATHAPSGLNATLSTQSVCPTSPPTWRPVAVSRSHTVRPLAAARIFPSGLMASPKHSTRSRAQTFFPVAVSQTVTGPP